MSIELMSQKRMVLIKEMIGVRSKAVMKANLQNHFAYQKRQIETISKNIDDFVKKSKKGELIRPIPASMDEVAYKMNELNEGLNQTFTLFIVGMGNYGKSTLINSLLGSEMAAVDFKPKTWKIDVYDSNMAPDKCLIIYKDGKKEEKPLNETYKFIEEEEKKADKSQKHVKAELAKISSDLKTVEAVREARAYLAKEFLYKSDIIEVRWPVKKNHLTEKFHLVDTPGLVQDNLSGETIVSLQKYYPKADGVLWILDASKIASKRSKDMIEDLEKSLEKVGGKTDNIIAVLNRIDTIRKNGGEEAVQAVLKDAEKIFGSYFKKIIPISAKQALDGILAKDKELIEQSGMLQLQNEIKNDFLKNAQKIQLSSKIIGYKQVLHQLYEDDHPIKSYFSRLEEDLSELSKRKAKIETKYKQQKKEYEKNLQSIIDKFSDSLKGRIEANAETLFDLETEASRKDYINKQILKFDGLEKELQKFMKHWHKELDASLKILQKEMVFTEYKFIDPYKLLKNDKETSKYSANNMNIKLNSGTIDTGDISIASGAGFAVIGAIVLGPIGLLLGGITGALGINKGIAKLFKSGKLKRQLFEAASEHIDTIQKNVLKEMGKLISTGEKNVMEVMNTTFCELHGDQKIGENIPDLFREFFETLEAQIEYPDFQELIIREYGNRK